MSEKRKTHTSNSVKDAWKKRNQVQVKVGIPIRLGERFDDAIRRSGTTKVAVIRTAIEKFVEDVEHRD